MSGIGIGIGSTVGTVTGEAGIGIGNARVLGMSTGMSETATTAGAPTAPGDMTDATVRAAARREAGAGAVLVIVTVIVGEVVEAARSSPRLTGPRCKRRSSDRPR